MSSSLPYKKSQEGLFLLLSPSLTREGGGGKSDINHIKNGNLSTSVRRRRREGPFLLPPNSFISLLYTLTLPVSDEGGRKGATSSSNFPQTGKKSEREREDQSPLLERREGGG